MSRANAEDRPVSLVIDRSACAGHGLCYSAAPAIVDSDDQGYPAIVAEPVPPELRAQLTNIVAACPERALSTAESRRMEG
jgi:ferredoxin